MKPGKTLLGGAAAMLCLGMAAPALAQQDNCYNEVDDGSGQPRCTVVGGGGSSGGGGGTDPRWVFGSQLADGSFDEDAGVIDAIADAVRDVPR